MSLIYDGWTGAAVVTTFAGKSRGPELAKDVDAVGAVPVVAVGQVKCADALLGYPERKHSGRLGVG